MVLRYKEIGEIIRLIEASSCDEFVLETDEVKLVLRRRGAGAGDVRPAPADSIGPAASGSNAPDAATAPYQHSVTAKPGLPDKPGVVSAPMVGTFYRAPAPDAPPFVEVASTVEPGDPLCVIEVMKLFTTIYAEFAGTVTEVAVENGQFVEYGQTLFVIESHENEDV